MIDSVRIPASNAIIQICRLNAMAYLEAPVVAAILWGEGNDYLFGFRQNLALEGTVYECCDCGEEGYLSCWSGFDSDELNELDDEDEPTCYTCWCWADPCVCSDAVDWVEEG